MGGGSDAGREAEDFPARLSRAIEERGLSLDRVSARLAERGVDCSSSTLSLWRRGHTRPRRLESLQAVQALEQILRTPPGHLTEAPPALAAGSREWWEHVARPEEVLHEGARLERMRETLGVQGAPELQRLAMIDIATIDARRRFCGSRCQTVVQAARDGAERIVVSTYRDGDAAEARGLRLVRPVEGVRLGRRRLEKGTGLVLNELILDAPLRRGERAVVSYDILPSEGPEPGPAGWGRHELRTVRPIGQLVLGVDFAPDALPEKVEVIEDPRDDDTDDERRREIALQGTRALVSRSTVHDGGLRVDWTWEAQR